MAVSQAIQEQMLKEAYSVTPNYSVDPNDKRFTEVNEQKDAALKELDATYAGMIGQTNQYYDDQIAALDKWEDKQTEIQNAQTDFTIQQIEQQKDKAHKDYLKEQSASYVDWQKQSNQYGANAEKMASAGLTNTGFAESSQVAMYNTHQNRVAMARESFNNAVLNYNNSIKEAQLANSAALAEIAITTLLKQLELSLAGFQYKNQLILEQANKKLEVDNMYWNRYQDVLQQINTENAMKEDIRQYNETMKWNTEQAQLDRDHEAQLKEDQRIWEAAENQKDRDLEVSEAALDRAHELTKQTNDHNNALALLAKEHANDLALLKASNASSGSSGGSSRTGSPGSSGSGKTYGSVNNSSKTYATIFDGNSGSSKQVSTNYYQGSLNSDASKYGTFSNGYQPKGISGYGKVTKTGQTIEVKTSYQYGSQKGQKVTVTQNVWKTPDGTLWYWEGRENKYKKVN